MVWIRFGVRIDLEWWVELCDLHSEEVRDGCSVVLQGHQAEISQTWRV